MPNKRKIYYFAYGSNMSSARLRSRISSAQSLCTATLYEHQLRFHKIGSRDGTAKCDAYRTGDRRHRVIGVLFTIDPDEKNKLDRHENAGNGYEAVQVNLETADGTALDAYTYRATLIDAGLKPFHWYRHHVLAGAMENRLPETYLDSIRQVETIDDPDHERHHREMAIYDKQ